MSSTPLRPGWFIPSFLAPLDVSQSQDKATDWQKKGNPFGMTLAEIARYWWAEKRATASMDLTIDSSYSYTQSVTDPNGTSTFSFSKNYTANISGASNWMPWGVETPPPDGYPAHPTSPREVGLGSFEDLLGTKVTILPESNSPSSVERLLGGGPSGGGPSCYYGLVGFDNSETGTIYSMTALTGAPNPLDDFTLTSTITFTIYGGTLSWTDNIVRTDSSGTAYYTTSHSELAELGFNSSFSMFSGETLWRDKKFWPNFRSSTYIAIASTTEFAGFANIFSVYPTLQSGETVGTITGGLILDGKTADLYYPNPAPPVIVNGSGTNTVTVSGTITIDTSDTTS